MSDAWQIDSCVPLEFDVVKSLASEILKEPLRRKLKTCRIENGILVPKEVSHQARAEKTI